MGTKNKKDIRLIKELVAKPEKKHNIEDFKTDETFGFKKDDSDEMILENIMKLREMQGKFYAHNKYAILIIFQAMDAAGKDGTIKHVMSGVNPQGCSVIPFKQPSKEELDHTYLWRIMKNMPERGNIGIFNRSHYEEVLVTKVHPEILMNQQLPDVNSLKDVDKDFWKRRYHQINNMEQYLVENGVIILKFFLNVSKDEQKKRFLSRLDKKEKNWKFSLADLKERAYWDDYMKAFEDMINETSTEYAPWYVIPADHKWFMRYAVGHIITEKLEELKVDYPTISDEEVKNLELAKQQLLNE